MFFRGLMAVLFLLCTTILSLSSGIFGCSGPADDDTTATTFPETCQEVQEQAVDETGDDPDDGTYTLYVNGDESRPWDAYCYNMRRADPVEYLTVDETENYSQIRNDYALTETVYRRYRIDPITFEIDPLDGTFADTELSDEFAPDLPVEDWEHIPAGWAEMQPVSFFDPERPFAQAKASLEGTAFVFAEDILDETLSAFFCQVDSAEFSAESTDGTGVEVSVDLTSFELTAVNLNVEQALSASTREVADCDNLGIDPADVTEAAWPLEYVGL